ncbi:MAG: hypothetical protein JW940_00200 [Polyangiaceae bacterium]|nr:hypothetical protein [Polyangiaceae bacterium]
MTRRTPRAAFVGFLALLCAEVSAAPASGIAIVGPAEVVGDGATHVRFRIQSGRGKPTDVLGVRVTITAGRIESTKGVEPGLLEVELVPPRVIEASEFVLEARSQAGRKERKRVRLLPVVPKSGVRASGGPLDLRVPEHMVLGVDRQATVSFRAGSVSTVSLYASIGALSAPRASEHGRTTAVFRPPDGSFPRVAVIVAASDDGSIVDWGLIRLYGRPIVATTSEPQARVRVRVAGEEYGPVQSDARGRAELRVLAPPGVREAHAVARDELGNERTITLDLGVPAAHTTFAICPSHSEGLFVFAVDAAGDPRSDLRITPRSSIGVLSQPKRAARGYYWSTLSLPSSALLGQPIHLEAKVEGGQGPSAACDTVVAGEAPNSLKLHVVPNRWIAGSNQPLEVRASVGYAGARKPRQVPLLATADSGKISPFVATSAGLARATWRLPARLGGRARARLSVQTAGLSPARDTLVIALVPGPPSIVTLVPERQRLPADGVSETVLTATVRDAYGNPVNTRPVVDRALGDVSPWERRAPGVFRATYTAPLSAIASQDRVRVRAGTGPAEAEAEATLTLGLVPVSDRYRLFGSAGVSTNFAKVSGLLGTVGAGGRLPWLRERVVVAIESGYFHGKSQGPDVANAEQVSVETTWVPVGARAQVELARRAFVPYLGAGVGLGVVRVDVSSASAGASGRWSTHPTAVGFGGVLVPTGPGSTFIEAGYRTLYLEEPSATGNVGGLCGTAGFAYGF